MAIFFVILMYATWSSIFAMGKVALENSPPVFLTAFRMLLAGIVLLSYLFFKNKKELKIGKKEIIPLLFLSLLSIYLTNILEFWSLQHLSAAKVCFIYSLSPFFAVILSYIHFKEKISQKKILGMLIGFIGFIPVLLLQTGAEDLFRAFTFFSWPELAMMGAALFSIYGWVILRILVKKQTLSPLYANGYSMFFGGLMALVHSFFVDSWFQSSHLLPVAEGKLLPFFQGICWMTFISNILCYNLYGFMLKKFTATFLSFMGLLSPLFASLTSWIMIGERPSWVILGSTGLVSLGLFIVYQAELSQGYIRAKEKVTTTA